MISNLSYLNKLIPHKNQKCAKQSLIYRTNSRICELDPKTHNDQDYTGYLGYYLSVPTVVTPILIDMTF